MPSQDITFCGYSNCPNKDCERHATHSKMTYNSFAYFEDCKERGKEVKKNDSRTDFDRNIQE